VTTLLIIAAGLAGCAQEELFIDGCPITTLDLSQCTEDGALLLRADCDNGDRWEIERDLVDGGGFDCVVNGTFNASSDLRGICDLDADDEADRAQLLIRLREGCGFEASGSRPFFNF
jgi:hypothetical protein